MKNILLIIMLLTSLGAKAQLWLDDSAKISILVGSPSEEEIFTVYGHAAVRVYDPQNKIDFLFNYGLFDFSKPNFAYRFAKGETDYRLGIIRYEDYVTECKLNGKELIELELNLTHREKNILTQALIENSKPENSVYRYNFFFDNCATRPVKILEQSIEGKVIYPPVGETKSFRELINHATRNKPWLTFGCDLALGSPTDRQTTDYEMMFLPVYMQQQILGAKIKNWNGEERPLVVDSKIIVEENLPEVEKDLITPLQISWILFIAVAALTIWGLRKNNKLLIIDYISFGVAGLAGCVLSFIAFFSEHPSVFPNWNLLFIHPLHLLALIPFAVKRLEHVAIFYHFINFAAIILLIAGWIFGEQHVNVSFVPLALILMVRSLFCIYLNYINRK